MLTNTYECLAIILRSLRLVANCIRKPIRLIFATFWRICREYIFLHSQGYSPQCESSIKVYLIESLQRRSGQPAVLVPVVSSPNINCFGIRSSDMRATCIRKACKLLSVRILYILKHPLQWFCRSVWECRTHCT